MVNNSFIEKYRNSAGYVLPPILNNGNIGGIVQNGLRYNKKGPAEVSYDGQNANIDRGRRMFPTLPKGNIASTLLTTNDEGNGVNLTDVRGVPKSKVIFHEKNLWRLDGRKANQAEYESKLDYIKDEIRNSKSFEDTAKILNRYAKSWDMNMYMLGQDETRHEGFYDWSPAAMFATELDIYKNKPIEEWPEGYTNEQWKKYLIDSINDRISTRARIEINPETVRMS